MTDEELMKKQKDDELFERKKQALFARHGSSAANTKFGTAQMEGFQKALEQNPNMTMLEYIASLVAKKK